MSCFVKWGASKLLNIKAATIRWCLLQRNHRFMNMHLFFLFIIHSYLLLKGRTRTKAMGISIPWSAFFTDKLFHSLVCNVKYSNLLCKENIKKLTTHVTGIVLFGIINYSTLFDVITRWPLFGSMSWRWYSANHNVPLWYATTYIIFIYI